MRKHPMYVSLKFFVESDTHGKMTEDSIRRVKIDLDKEGDCMNAVLAWIEERIDRLQRMCDYEVWENCDITNAAEQYISQLWMEWEKYVKQLTEKQEIRFDIEVPDSDLWVFVRIKNNAQ